MKILLPLILCCACVVPTTPVSATDLFDGQTLSGWTVDKEALAGHWSVRDGLIHGANPDKKGSVLWTDAEYGDYHLELEFKTPSKDYDSGVFLHGPSHQVQIGISRSLKKDLTGALYCPVDQNGKYPQQPEVIATAHRPGEWNTLKAVVRGKHIRTYLNGVLINDYQAVKFPKTGKVGLQLHGGVHMEMVFRNLRLSPLEEKEEMPLLLGTDFEGAGALQPWHSTQPTMWSLVDAGEGNKALKLHGKSAYQPPVRSPHSIALLKDLPVGDFVLTARVKTLQTSRGHRDMCVFFGWQDPSHFYYVHLGEKQDPHSSQIFIVNGAPRAAITTENTGGIPWQDDHWHDVKVVRKVSDGTIAVYFDDMSTPAKVAKDTSFGDGLIGLGSFDDLGLWDDVKVYGVGAEGVNPVLPEPVE